MEHGKAAILCVAPVLWDTHRISPPSDACLMHETCKENEKESFLILREPWKLPSFRSISGTKSGANIVDRMMDCWVKPGRQQ